MTVELRPRTAVLVLVAVLLAGALGSAGIADVAGGEPDRLVHYVPLAEDERQLWLYTSRGQTFREPTLAVNVIVYGDPGEVRALLLETGRGDWNETAAEERELAPDEPLDAAATGENEWAMADGSNRYLFLTGNGGGRWLSESFQIHDGDYLGSRHHVRAYTPPEEGEWIAMQAHHEHWDWFSVRHVVPSTDQSQGHLEREFATVRGAPEIRRIPTDTAGAGGFDRWVTIVDFGSSTAVATALLSGVLLIGAVGARARDVSATLGAKYPESDMRAVLLGLGLVGVVLGVRLAGVRLERALAVSPKSIAVLLYPAIFVGLPIVAARLARPLDPARAFVGASVGYLAAILVDYSSLGVTQLALDTLVHRGALAVALGLIAVGCTHAVRERAGRRNHLRRGVLLWLVAMVLPLLRHTPLPV